MRTPGTTREPIDGSTGSGSTPGRTAVFLGVPAAVIAGALVAAQSRVNSALAVQLGGGFTGGVEAAVVSFGTGLVLLTLLAFASRPMRAGLRRVRDAVRGGGLRPWQILGGLSGAFLVASQGLTVASIGVALFVVATVAGQSASALFVDHRGIGPAGPQRVTGLRAVGAAIAVLAVAIGVSGRLSGDGALHGPVLVLLALPLVAGAATSWQQAVNGRVGAVGGPLPATWVNFAVGMSALVLTLAAAAAFGAPVSTPPAPGAGHWWLYLGGPIGIAFIALAAWLVHELGVLLLGLASVVGQVLGALVLDVVGGHPVTATTVAGAVLTLVGVGLAALSTARARPGPRGRSG